jgi:aspartyl-tRNA(Asn)/glutamyl-tRNA(Gln) amidotransferase subunit B
LAFEEAESAMSAQPFEIVIGLEVHVQLATRTKLFCRCSTRFGALPNTQTCPVCLGLPGALPVMNRQAFQLALKTAVALNCQIPSFTKWDRKQYYYPDLPKGYQISQYDLPLSHDGWLEIRDPKHRFETKKVRIIRAHLEEDAGKSMHDEVLGRADSRIDLNRAGTPLLEIVSQPDLRSPVEARTYLSELKLLLTYLGVSDCNMQEGSLRVDANINLHMHEGDETIPTPIVEVKNMNSFRAVERALEFEAQRQYELWRKSRQRLGEVPKQTRGWDDQAEVTKPQRGKEESSDYRYFPDPDLVPVTINQAEVERMRALLGRLPAQTRDALEAEYGLSPYDADVIVNQGREVVEYFERVAKATGDPRRSSNWIQQDVLRTLNENAIPIGQFGISADELSRLIIGIRDGELEVGRARDVYAKMLSAGLSYQAALSQLGIEKVADSELFELCRSLLASNPRIAEDVRNGKQQAIGSLVGQAKKRNPNVNPGRVREILLQMISSAPS